MELKSALYYLVPGLLFNFPLMLLPSITVQCFSTVGPVSSGLGLTGSYAVEARQRQWRGRDAG